MEAATVKFALGKLDDLLKKGLELHNVGDEIRLMQLELRMIEGFLQDADSKRNGNPAVQQWVNEVREVAYRIGPIIDTFLAEIEGNHGRRFGLRSKLDRLVRKPFKLKKLADQVKAIRKTLRTISQVRADLGITNTGSSSEENDRAPFRPTRPEEIDDSEVVGLDCDKRHIISHLLDTKDLRRAVLSIVGTGGLGKTTLAKKVYESTELVGKFDYRIWLSISQNFNVNDLLREILRTVDPNLRQKGPPIECNNLTSALQGYLNRNRYLIVLDDVWTTDLWKRLKIALPDEKNGSRVLITSRFEHVAKAADGDTKPYKLRYLNDDESLALLFRKAFPNKGLGESYQPSVQETSDQTCYVQHYPADLCKVAKELTKKCGGLPLALIVVGGILSKRESIYAAWQKVNDTLDWHYEEGKDCSLVLLLSYKCLPYHLKPCFLYFAAFSEDYQISAKHVIRMWIAEGFISKDGGGTMEDRAEEFLEELVQRCLVEVVEKSWNGNCKICGMHDLLRDMAIHEAKKDNFFTVCSKADDCSQLASETVHRASVQYSIPTNFSIHSTSILSLLCFGQYISNYRGFRQLRVLTIERVNMGAKKINYEGLMEGLIHLRYLGFRYCTLIPVGFERLSFRSMMDLETVDCKGTHIAFPKDSTPLSLWKVRTLKHLIINWIENAPPLPSKWDELKNLQTLKWVRLENFPKLKPECNINLRTLGVYTQPDSDQEGTLTNLLKRTEHLVSLHIAVKKTPFSGTDWAPISNWARARISIWAMTDLQCHKTIQCLYLEGACNFQLRHHQLPPPNLTKLTLVRSELTEDPMPILEGLQCLRILRLWENAVEEQQLTCRKGGFPSLQKLEFRNLRCLKHWDIEKGAMPRLTHLEITACGKLHSFPELQNVSTLKELKLEDKLHKEILRGDYYKIKHIPSVRTVLSKDITI